MNGREHTKDSACAHLMLYVLGFYDLDIDMVSSTFWAFCFVPIFSILFVLLSIQPSFLRNNICPN